MKLLGRLLLIFCGILSALVIAELVLRIIPHQQDVVPFLEYYDAPCFKNGTFFWFGFKKNNRCIVKSKVKAFPDFEIRTNSLGLRGGELISPKPNNSVRVLFIGDSFTLGWGVKEEESYPDVVGKILQKKYPSKKIEIVNAGLIASSTGYDYLVIKNLISVINPDIVVIGFYPANDIYEPKYITKWSLDKDGLPIASRMPRAFVDSKGEMYSAISPIPFNLTFLSNFRLTFVMTNIASYFSKPQLPDVPFTYIKMCVFEPNCHYLDQTKNKIKNLFVVMNSLTKQFNSKLVVVIIPAEFQIYTETRMAKYLIPYSIFPDKRKLPSQEFGYFFSKNNIDYLPLLPVFDQHLDDKPFYAKDDHWNSLGHNIAGQAIEQKIEQYISE